MSDQHARLEDLIATWNTHKAYDDQKHSLIENLFSYIEDLSKKCSEAEDELLDKKIVIKSTRGRVEDLERQIQALQLEKNRYGFASVLIDGDCMPFKDDLVKAGVDGGKRAATLLKQAVEENLQSSGLSTPHHMQIVVRVYANLEGLAKIYAEMEILPQAAFSEFVRGFNMGNVMCDYIDAGNGKECSDEKLKANFLRDLADVHCQQILFGVASDNGYARLLAPLTEDVPICRRITLLEGPPFARELADIQDKFRTVSFESVFRTRKLVNTRYAAPFHLAYPDNSSKNHTGAAAEAPASPSPRPPPAAPHNVALPGGPITTKILRNGSGQRVDPPLIYSNQDFSSIKNRKLCNNFYLLGRCRYKETLGKCQHDHTAALTSKQMTALRAVARQSYCQKGLYCDDPQCICGHRCPRDNCVRKNCWFPLEMHAVDTKIVQQI